MHWNLSKLSIYKYPSSGTTLVPSARRRSTSSCTRPCLICISRAPPVCTTYNPLGALFPPHNPPSTAPCSTRIPISKLVRWAPRLSMTNEWIASWITPRHYISARIASCQTCTISQFLDRIPDKKVTHSSGMFRCPLAHATVNHLWRVVALKQIDMENVISGYDPKPQ